MAQKQQQQEQSHADAIRLYWTPDRIRSAKQKKYNRVSVSRKTQAAGQDNAIPEEVPDNIRKIFPYQSVGKLVFMQNGTNYQTTAFVVDTGKGNNIVFTAAHNLYDKDGPVYDIMFIPACQNNGQPVPKYGSFTQIPGGIDEAYFVPKKWFDKADPYADFRDLGAVKLERNRAGCDVGEVVSMLKYKVDLECMYKVGVTEWRIIGYTDNTMYQSDGVYDLSDCDGQLVVRKNQFYDGASGSPWLFKDKDGKFTIVNGDHSGSSPGFSVSPYYSTALVVNDIIAQL